MAAANIINLILFKKNVNSFIEESTGNNSVLTHTSVFYRVPGSHLTDPAEKGYQ
ncbi:hypothetical protein BD410DRAFT_796166 [Rickenella mellea]|uniref:Uncharacterized protein n=1 Tax=Rickenella mellea TaxID=50990 RepID=A0A4Y7PJX7_9AGAM|nr:hypothetical protein BD410DRAFT_796166 [Rickenella mellea]